MTPELLGRLGAWIDTGPLEQALPRRPRCIAVVGRTSAGKSTLINRITGSELPTGLGGVTDVPLTVLDGEQVWVDTPGIDDPDRAVDVLVPLLDQAHGVVWVVDGLQPVTHTERRVLELAIPEGVPVQVVVSRGDLLGDEGPQVAARVHELTGREAKVVDLRRGPLPDLDHWPPTAKEKERMDVARAQALEALTKVAGPVDPAHLAAAIDLRPRVKAFMEQLQRQQLSFPDLMQAWRDGLAALASDVVIGLAADPQLAPHVRSLPELPPTPDPTADALEVLRLSAAGTANTFRELRAMAAGWALEAQAALSEWEVPTDAERARELTALRRELAESD